MVRTWVSGLSRSPEPAWRRGAHNLERHAVDADHRSGCAHRVFQSVRKLSNVARPIAFHQLLWPGRHRNHVLAKVFCVLATKWSTYSVCPMSRNGGMTRESRPGGVMVVRWNSPQRYLAELLVAGCTLNVTELLAAQTTPCALQQPEAASLEVETRPLSRQGRGYPRRPLELARLSSRFAPVKDLVLRSSLREWIPMAAQLATTSLAGILVVNSPAFLPGSASPESERSSRFCDPHAIFFTLATGLEPSMSSKADCLSLRCYIILGSLQSRGK